MSHLQLSGELTSVNTQDHELRAYAVSASQGDLDAARELITAVHPFLFSTLHLLGIPTADVEDLGQEIVLEMYRSLPRYHPAQPFLPWFKSICRHRASNYWRSRVRREQNMERFYTSLDQFVHEDVVMEEDSEVHGILASCVEKLRAPQHQILNLRYYHGLNSSAIAEQLGAQPSAIRRALMLIRGTLRRCVESSGYVPERG